MQRDLLEHVIYISAIPYSVINGFTCHVINNLGRIVYYIVYYGEFICIFIQVGKYIIGYL